MKKNNIIILIITITIIALIIGLLYYSRNTSYAEIVETFAKSSNNPYSNKLSYTHDKPKDDQHIYNENVLKSQLPIVYDVDPKNVNMCYGNGKSSIYTYPYIILVLRAQYLQSNGSTNTDEYKDILKVLRNGNNTFNLNNEASLIMKHSKDSKILKEKTGPRMIKTCSRLFPNWLKNPTKLEEPNNSRKLPNTQINVPANILVNNRGFVSETRNNPNTFAFLYAPESKKPIKSTLSLDTATNIIPQYKSSGQISNPYEVPSDYTQANELQHGVSSSDKMLVLDYPTFTNNNATLDNYLDSPYCKKYNMENKDAIEWTHEFSLQNNISAHINDKDICIKLLLNPLTGDILERHFVRFHSNKLHFDAVEPRSHIYANMVSLMQIPITPNQNSSNVLYGITPNTFNNAPKIDKYIFDNCGRLYGVPTGDTSYNLGKKKFNITHVYPELVMLINNTSTYLTGLPMPGYNLITQRNIKLITENIIDNINNLPTLFHDKIKEEFTADKFRINHEYININNNVNKNFSSYFTKTRNRTDFSKIVKYTSSDGYIYINLGQIPDIIYKDITDKINPIVEFTKSELISIVNIEINIKTKSIIGNTEILTTKQTEMYERIDIVSKLINYAVTIMSGVPATPLVSAVPALYIPYLSKDTRNKIKEVITTGTNADCGDKLFEMVQNKVSELSSNEVKDIYDGSYLILDPNGHLKLPINNGRNSKDNSIPYILNEFIKSTTSNENAASIYTTYNLRKLKNVVSLFNKTNIESCNETLDLIMDSLKTLLKYQNKCVKEYATDIKRDTQPLINASYNVEKDKVQLLIDKIIRDVKKGIYNSQNPQPSNPSPPEVPDIKTVAGGVSVPQDDPDSINPEFDSIINNPAKAASININKVKGNTRTQTVIDPSIDDINKNIKSLKKSKLYEDASLDIIAKSTSTLYLSNNVK